MTQESQESEPYVESSKPQEEEEKEEKALKEEESNGGGEKVADDERDDVSPKLPKLGEKMLEPSAAAQQAPEVVLNWPPGKDVEKTKHVRVRFTCSSPDPERGWGRRYQRVHPPPSATSTAASTSASTSAKPASLAFLSPSPPAAQKAGAAQGAWGGVASAATAAAAVVPAAKKQKMMEDDPKEEEEDKKDNNQWRTEGSEYIGRKVRRYVWDSRNKLIDAADGVVVGWLSKEESDYFAEASGEPAPIFHMQVFTKLQRVIALNKLKSMN